MYPRLLTFGHIALPTYGALIAISVIAALLLAIAIARRVGVSPDRIWTLGLFAVFSTILGSKLLLIATNWSSFIAAPRLLLSLPAMQSPGIYLVAILLAVVVCLSYALYARLPLLRTSDIAAPALALGQSIAAIGCLAAGCGYGQPMAGAGRSHWGLVFSSRFAERTTGVPLGLPLYPTQIVESLGCLSICAALLWLFARPHRDGDIAGAWLFLYGSGRFFLEFYRGDAGRGSFFGGACTGVQLLAAGMVVLSGVIWSVTFKPHARLELHGS